MQRVQQLDLINRLKAATKTAWTDGCGLAAIQIGIPLRFAWFSFLGKEEILLNPEIIASFGKQVYFNEGCLSIPDQFVNTERALSIVYISDGKKYKAKGTRAIVIQHEIDHLNGILNVDRVKKG